MSLELEDLIERYKNPVNKGIKNSSCCGESKNYSCGDTIKICLEVNNGKIKNAKFDGEGCAISQTTADKLCDYLIGKETSVIKTLDFEKLKEITELEPSIGRIKCVMISLDALKSTRL